MFAAVVFCIAGIFADSGLNKVLRFPEEVSTNNYIKMTPDFSDIGSSVSVCTWMKNLKVSTNSKRFWFSYAVPKRDNEILFAAYVEYWFKQVGYNWNPVRILKNQWYHFCFTWSAGKTMDSYLNGVLMKSQACTVTGIASGGILVLGQEQDSFGGTFDINQSFGGDLQQLNVFSRKLRLEEVASMFFDGRCSPLPSSLEPDVVLSWEEILRAQPSGDVQKVSAECRKRDERSFLGKVTKLVLQELDTCNEL